MGPKAPKVSISKKIRKNGVTYYIRYTIDGKEHFEPAGYNERDAEISKTKVQHEFNLGTHEIPTDKCISIKDLFGEYNKYKAKRIQQSTMDRYKDYKTPFVNFLEKNFPAVCFDIRLLKKLYIEEFLETITDEETWKFSTANDALAHIKSVLKYAVSERYLSKNPADAIVPYKEDENTKDHFITPEHLQLLYKNMKPSYWIDVFQFLFHTGLRSNEIRNLRWEHIVTIDNDKFIQLTRNEEFRLKQGRTLRIPLDEVAKKILERKLVGNNSVYVFTIGQKPFAGERIGIERLGKVLRKARVDAELKTLYTVHDFRHTFASLLRKRGASISYISELLGHSDAVVTKKYAHLLPADLIHVLALLPQDDYFGSIGKDSGENHQT
jgi:integrase